MDAGYCKQGDDLGRNYRIKNEQNPKPEFWRLLSLSFVACLALPDVASADFEAPSQGPVVMMPGATQARPWDLSMRAFVGRDTNVALAPDVTGYSGRKGSAFFGGSAMGTYRLIQTQEWLAGIMGKADFQRYRTGMRDPETDAPNEYNLKVVNPGLFARRFLNLGSLPASVGVAYDYRREWLPVGGGGLKSHTAKADAEISLTDRLKVGANVTYGNDDASVTFANPDLNGRDSHRNAYGLTGSYQFPWHFTKVSLGYTHSENNAQGQNFDYEGDKLSARVETHIYGPVWLALDVARDERDYNGFQSFFIPAPGRNSQEIFEYGGQLLWQFDRNWIADLFIRRSEYDSNQAEFEAERWKFGVGLTYRF